jgi:hypothetical protein
MLRAGITGAAGSRSIMAGPPPATTFVAPSAFSSERTAAFGDEPNGSADGNLLILTSFPAGQSYLLLVCYC